MRKNNNAILFEKDFLNNLVKDESSLVEIQEQNYHLALHPFHLNNINESLKDILNQGIAKYDKKLDGILLGYQNIKLLSQSGAVTNDSFFIHIDIAASFFLFKPEVEKILAGTVNKKSKDHVACLVHKTFNISLPKPEEADDDWMGAKVEIGQDILFRITFVNLEARLPYIRAEFMALLGEQDSGISTSEENMEKSSNKAIRKSKKIVFESNSEAEESKTAKKKKKKKRKKEEKSENVGKEKEKRKKHKHKLNKEENLDSLDGKKKKKSKHKDQPGVLELEVVDEYNHKKKKSKHKSRSHKTETDRRKSIEYEAHKKEKPEKTVTKDNEHSKHKQKDQLYEDESLISENSKMKKGKHKYDLAEVADLETKKKKKSKRKERENKDLNETNINDDLSSLLPELNLSSLFSESVSNKSTPKDNFQMADNEDKISKKRRGSTSHANFWDSKTKLMTDSDLEKIIQDVDKNSKHKKEGCDESPKKLSKKRRRSPSSDDLVAPVPKKKHKKSL